MSLSFRQFLKEVDENGTDPAIMQLQAQLTPLKLQLSRMTPQKMQLDDRYNKLKMRIDRLEGMLSARQAQAAAKNQQQQTQQPQQAQAAPGAAK